MAAATTVTAAFDDDDDDDDDDFESSNNIRDLFRNTKSYCTHCSIDKENTEQKQLLRCSRCQVCQYCSVNCQKASFASHKSLCRKVAAIRKQVMELDTYQDIYHTSSNIVGATTEVEAERSRHTGVNKLYIESRILLGRYITKITYHSRPLDTTTISTTTRLEMDRSMYELALYEFYECYRMSPFINGSETGLLFLLSILGYHDHAISIIKFMTDQNPRRPDEDNQFSIIHPLQFRCNDAVKEGQWMFSPLVRVASTAITNATTEQDESSSEPTNTIDPKRIVLGHPQEGIYLFVLLLVKMKLLANLSKEKERFTIFLQTMSGTVTTTTTTTTGANTRSSSSGGGSAGGHHHHLLVQLLLPETELIISEYLWGGSTFYNRIKEDVINLLFAMKINPIIWHTIKTLLPLPEATDIKEEDAGYLFNRDCAYNMDGNGLMIYFWRLYTSSFRHTPGMIDILTELFVTI